MASNYTGNPSAVQSPGVAPGPGILPTLSLIQDADGNTAANLYQAWKVTADQLAFWGFPGRYGQFRERWDIAPATVSTTTNPIADLAKRWSYSIVAGATQTLVYQNPGTATGSYSGRTIKLDQGTGGAGQQSYISTTNGIWTPSGATYRFLLEFDAQATTSTLNSREWHLGLSTTMPGSNINDTCTFYSDYTLANWQANTGGAQTDTGVPVSIGSTWVRFAILIDTTIITPSVTFYINNSLVATRTTGLPVAGTLYNLLFGGRQNSTGVCSFTLGQVTATWSPTF